jgi:hypothetical protein
MCINRGKPSLIFNVLEKDGKEIKIIKIKKINMKN